MAHEIRPAFLKITEIADGETFEASFRQPQIAGRFLGLSLATNCNQTSIAASVNDAALTEVFELQCGDEGLTEIEIVGLDRTLIDTLVSIIRVDGEQEITTNLLITGDEPRLVLTDALPSLPIYLGIGFEHLILGYDHILFLLMLVYLVRKPLQLVKVITSFTVAHSITLALSAFDVLTLSQAPIEAVIAGSIVLLAYENLQEKRTVSRDYPVIIAFSFGLLHGLGFAGALTEIGLPESSQLMALFLFNVGIELGQLAMVAVMLIALAALRFRFNRLVYEAPIYLAGSVACFWFFQRSWLIVNPLFI